MIIQFLTRRNRPVSRIAGNEQKEDEKIFE